MTRKEMLLLKLGHELKTDLLAEVPTNPQRLFIDIKRQALIKTSEILIGQGARYQVATGYDARKSGQGFALVHSFAFDQDSLIVAVRAFAPEENPEFDSLTPYLPGAGWAEREYIDLLGLRFKDHPEPKRLVLSDDWPAGIHPLRRDIPHDLMPPAAEEVAFRLEQPPKGTSVIPFGPFHASLHEPAHFSVYVDGEDIKGCEYRGLYDSPRH